MNENEYRAINALSGSELSGLLCPAKFKENRDNPKEATEAMRFGSLVHSMIFEPHKVKDQYAVMPEGMIRRGKKYEEWLAQNQGKEEFKADGQYGYNKAKDVVAAFNLSDQCKPIMEAGGLNEYPIYWDESGVKCKGRLDRYLSELYVIVDYKTTNDASPDKFYWKVNDLGYLLQLAHYQAGIKQLTGKDTMPGILIMAQETEAPYVCQVYEVPQEMIDSAHAKRKELLEVYKECMETGIWHGYGKEMLKLERR